MTRRAIFTVDGRNYAVWMLNGNFYAQDIGSMRTATLNIQDELIDDQAICKAIKTQVRRI